MIARLENLNKGKKGKESQVDTSINEFSALMVALFVNWDTPSLTAFREQHDIAITGSGVLDGQAVHRAVVEQRLQQALAERGDSLELHLRADRGTRYEKVADVMAAAQRVGIAKIAFVTEAPPQ